MSLVFTARRPAQYATQLELVFELIAAQIAGHVNRRS